MKYVPSIAFDEMSGSAKGVTAAKSRGRKYIRNRGYGGGVRTSAQAAVKSVFKQLTQSWKNLTNAQILAWNALAQTQAGKSVLGPAAKITGTPSSAAQKANSPNSPTETPLAVASKTSKVPVWLMWL